MRRTRRARHTPRGWQSFALGASAIAAALGALAFESVAWAQPGRCVDSPNVPLPDLVQVYRGLAPGLYPGGRATRSESELAAGLEQSRRVEPLDATGRPSTGGRIILLALGMSNTAAEVARFVAEARAEHGVNPRVAIANGALSSADTTMWTNAGGPAWQHVRSTLRGQYAPAQVQVIWMKHARLRTVPFPGEVEQMAAELEATLGIARDLFPNLRLMYVSSRTRSGAVSRRGPGEPQAYETAFAVRRLLERQATREASGAAPVVTWGPYLWANDAERSDGLAWTCADLQQDLLHPSEAGALKVAQQLMAFFMTDSTTTPWFTAGGGSRAGSKAVRVRATASAGPAPLAVTFSAENVSATRYYWAFGDGTSSVAARPRKTFFRDGTFDVRVTTTDESGAVSTSSVQVRVSR